jgi:Endonuclease NucS
MIKLFTVDGGNLVPLQYAQLPREDMLEDWIARDPKILGLNVVLIGRQIMTDFGGRIDILAIDREGKLTIVELKRDKSPREIVAQVLDYASWVNTLSPKDVYDIAFEYLGKSLDTVFSEAFDIAVPENLNSVHNMVIIASELDASSKRIVEYLSKVHDLSINTLFFSTFEHDGELLMGADWLMDQAEVVTRSVSNKKPRAPWSGFWYVNADDCKARNWEDCRRLGFLGAGGGRIYSDQLQRLDVGDQVFVYQKKAGYVGYGVVTQKVRPAREFVVDGRPLSECVQSSPDLLNHRDDPAAEEYVIGVEWRKTFPIAEAKKLPGMFANQNVVCKLSDPGTLEFLKPEFEIS